MSRPQLRLVQLLAGALTLAGALMLTGCLGERCSAGQLQEGPNCVSAADAGPAGSDAASDAASDAVAPAAEASVPTDGGPGEGSSADAAHSKQGDICVTQPECVGTFDFCAIIPGQKQGYCTNTGCTVKPDSCTAPYFCMDLSAYAPGLTACIKL